MIESASFSKNLNKKDKRCRISKWWRKEKPMTVCIAAISENLTGSPKIVFASDRLVSGGVCFEAGVSKIQPLSVYAWIMSSSNDALASDGIILKIQEMISAGEKAGKTFSIEQIANAFSLECKNRLKSEREKQIFSQYGLTEDEFKNKSSELSELVVKDILDKLHEFKYDFEVEFLLIGFDSQPYLPHINTINEFGDIQISDHMGFATIGSGKYLAFPEMTKYAYHPNTPLSESVMRVYWSKKVAERVGGVGKETDLLVLHVDPKTGIRFWASESAHKKILDDAFALIRSNEVEISLKTISELGLLFGHKNDTETSK
jgi:hypothetical protein